MADIDLQRRPGGGAGWIWWVVGLLIVGLIIWWAWPSATRNRVTRVAVPPSEQVPPAGAPAPGGVAAVAPNVGFDQITAHPQQYIGRTLPTTDVTVVEVPTNHGFWIEKNGNRLFAVVIPQPEPLSPEIKPGARLRITDGELQEPSYVPEIPGAALMPQAGNLARKQRVFVILSQSEIQILQPRGK